MKTASGPLIALLNSGTDFQQADLWTITLSGGTVIRWSGADKALVANSQTFALGPLIERTTIEEKIGLEAVSMDVTITGDSNDTINGVPVIQFIAQRGFDGAVIKLERAFFPTWSDPVTGTILRFGGKVTSVNEIKGESAQVTVSSWLMLLDTMMPTDLYQASCLHTVYNSGCGLNPADFDVSGSVTSGSTTTLINSGLSMTANDYAQGRMVFTSGPNTGVQRGVKSNTTSGITVVSPFPFVPAVGNTFTVFKGCDRTRGTCLTKFNNLLNYKGTDFVPVPEASL
jgi:uncharacterized phage protein (TIGR02218 family)